MTQAVDYSFARPDPTMLAGHGYTGVLRYLAPLPNKKVVTAEEIAAVHSAGLAVGFVWEAGATRPRQGYSAGVTDAQSANGLADNLGIPGTVTIYYAVDYDANPDEITAYFDGARSVGRRPVGGYGSFRVIERLLDDGLIVKAWQTVAWSRGKRSGRAHLYQRADAAANPPAGTDVNDILADDWGQWAPDTQPQPTQQPEEDIVTGTYVKRNDSPQVHVLLSSGEHPAVTTFGVAELILKAVEVRFVDPPYSVDVNDGYDTRKVWPLIKEHADALGLP